MPRTESRLSVVDLHHGPEDDVEHHRPEQGRLVRAAHGNLTGALPALLCASSRSKFIRMKSSTRPVAIRTCAGSLAHTTLKQSGSRVRPFVSRTGPKSVCRPPATSYRCSDPAPPGLSGRPGPRETGPPHAAPTPPLPRPPVALGLMRSAPGPRFAM